MRVRDRPARNGSCRMIAVELDAQALGGELARRVAREAQRFGDRRAEERIAKRVEDQRKRALGYLVLLVADAELRDQAANRIEDRIERVAVAGEDHPGGECARTFPVEHVEAAVDDVPRIALARPRPLDRLGDAGRDRFGDGARKLSLKPCRRAEMVKQVGVGASDFGGDGLQRHCLWTVGEQQPARGLNRGGAALSRAQSFATY